VNELALFAGAGGGILGGHLLGWRTICAVEWEPFPASVLCARQNEGIFPPFPIWDDVQTFDGKPWRGRVDVVSGGFPCQDISAAGKGAGIDGERSGMWGHMARIVREVEPRFVFVENSPMLTSRGLGRVLGDLASMGYDARWGVLGAVHAGAPHKRDRIWIVGCNTHGNSKPACTINAETFWVQGDDADTNAERLQVSESQPSKVRPKARTILRSRTACGSCEDGKNVADTISKRTPRGKGWGEDAGDASSPSADVADRHGVGLEGCGAGPSTRNRQIQGEPMRSGGTTWWESDPAEREGDETEPDVGRVAHGVAARVDRLKAIGNGQVPAVAALAWQILSADLAAQTSNRNSK